jgi:hypothetical protein
MLNLEVLDFRRRIFTDADAKQILDKVGSGKFWQVQARCDSQMLCNAVRERIMRHAMESGKQFEITILGSGAAVGVKMHMPPQYIYDPATGRDVPRDEWIKTHPGTA